MKVGKEMDTAVEARVFKYKWSDGRCPICGWPFAKDRKDGCRPDDCSLRPAPAKRADAPRPFSTDLVEAFSVVEKLEVFFPVTSPWRRPGRSGTLPRSGTA